jgi:hypothetical protein
MDRRSQPTPPPRSHPPRHKEPPRLQCRSRPQQPLAHPLHRQHHPIQKIKFRPRLSHMQMIARWRLNVRPQPPHSLAFHASDDPDQLPYRAKSLIRNGPIAGFDVLFPTCPDLTATSSSCPAERCMDYCGPGCCFS